MEIFIVLSTIILIVLFLFLSRKFHQVYAGLATFEAKIYVDNRLIEINGNQVFVNSKQNSNLNVGHFEEFIDALNRCVIHKEIFSEESLANQIHSILKSSAFIKYFRRESFSHQEQTSFLSKFQYGGCYFETADGLAMVHALGKTEAILSMCSVIHDKEEIQRVSDKMEKQQYNVVAVATADVYGDKKNVLARGVKEKMTFLGLIAVKKLELY